MSLTIKTFASAAIRGAAGSARQLVDRCPSTAVAFIDDTFGNPANAVTIVDQGLQAGAEVDLSATVVSGGYPVAVEVTSKGAGEFSLHDGTTWQGPFPVPADVTHAMLVRPSAPDPTIRVKWHATHSSNRVFVRASEAVSPAQLLAI